MHIFCLPSARVSAVMRIAAVAPLVAMSACLPTGPDVRRAAYLDCARDQGVTVRDGTILSRGPSDLVRLDACEALPR